MTENFLNYMILSRSYQDLLSESLLRAIKCCLNFKLQSKIKNVQLEERKTIEKYN
jgi:hypothetical protein